MIMNSGFIKFAELIRLLGIETKTNEKLRSLVDFLKKASDQDKVWLIALFTGRRPKRSIKTSLLTKWCIDITGLSSWLFTESYHTVGDLAETIALLIPDGKGNSYKASLLETIETIQRVGSLNEDEQFSIIKEIWFSLNKDERFVFNKLITGNFRIGVSDPKFPMRHVPD